MTVSDSSSPILYYDLDVRGRTASHEGRMNRWCRVFSRNDASPQREALARTILAMAPGAAVQWDEGEQGWLRCEIQLAGHAEPLAVDRFLREEEGIRAELQAWAAWLETTDNEHAPALMRHLIGTQQVFTLKPPETREEDASIEQVCLAVCQFLAKATEGVYQIDEQGFFDAEGTLLVQEL